MQVATRELLVSFVPWLVPMLLFAAATGGEAAELLVGGATTNITPDKPVALCGQFHTRIARSVDNPCTATAVAIEARDGERVIDQAIMVSCDLSAIWGTTQEQLRERVKARLPGFDPKKLFLNATHTHTAPVLVEGQYDLPKEGVIQPAEYMEFLLGRLSDAVATAWEGRKSGGVSWALGHAAVGSNRRAVYENGTARMYGATDTPDFRAIEGYQDHSVDVLFFWDNGEKPVAMAIDLACTSQEVEGRSTVNADFWHDVREQLHKTYAPDLLVLGWVSAAGDQSPHLLYNKRAEERMRVRRGLTPTQEIARRICRAVDDVFEVARGDIRTAVPFVHRVETLKLPVRKVTEADVAKAKAQLEQLAKRAAPAPGDYVQKRRFALTIERFEKQEAEPTYEMELHVLRIGDVAIATCPFELYLDYGVQIKARSRAVQTFLIQLACAPGGYLPTEKAVKGGGYSALAEDNCVGPEGGKLLVHRTVELINALWPVTSR